jgi:hypothetical protein
MSEKTFLHRSAVASGMGTSICCTEYVKMDDAGCTYKESRADLIQVVVAVVLRWEVACGRFRILEEGRQPRPFYRSSRCIPVLYVMHGVDRDKLLWLVKEDGQPSEFIGTSQCNALERSPVYQAIKWTSMSP